MNRLIVLPAVAVLLAALAPACGDEPTGAADTLPSIRTTTTTSTTTTTPDMRRKFYEVKAGDNLAEIAAMACVPAAEIVRLNNLEGDGNYLEVGQIIEIPTDMVLIDLTTSTSVSESAEQPAVEESSSDEGC